MVTLDANGPNSGSLAYPIGSDVISTLSRKTREREGVILNTNGNDSHPNPILSALTDSDDLPQPKKRKVEVPLTCIRPPPLSFPRSLYRSSPQPRYAEDDIIEEVLVGGTRIAETYAYEWLTPMVVLRDRR